MNVPFLHSAFLTVAPDDLIVLLGSHAILSIDEEEPSLPNVAKESYQDFFFLCSKNHVHVLVPREVACAVREAIRGRHAGTHPDMPWGEVTTRHVVQLLKDERCDVVRVCTEHLAPDHPLYVYLTHAPLADRDISDSSFTIAVDVPAQHITLVEAYSNAFYSAQPLLGGDSASGGLIADDPIPSSPAIRHIRIQPRLTVALVETERQMDNFMDEQNVSFMNLNGAIDAVEVWLATILSAPEQALNGARIELTVQAPTFVQALETAEQSRLLRWEFLQSDQAGHRQVFVEQVTREAYLNSTHLALSDARRQANELLASILPRRFEIDWEEALVDEGSQILLDLYRQIGWMDERYRILGRFDPS
ncbi:uncharacterized protein PSFLO_03339 [Pseudozyma flocculosa]|uniref:Uncharacterized protein n=1 Tax=Pseudozyma flocculosa TaxID=84751 RepID=A0A5C3F0P9_9BASI|nr:uncharacterized protein PSFLO_03339 [Pseudozyma flocculosa]